MHLTSLVHASHLPVRMHLASLCTCISPPCVHASHLPVCMHPQARHEAEEALARQREQYDALDAQRAAERVAKQGRMQRGY